MKKYINMIIGAFIIALSFNVFFKTFNFVSSGLLGLSTIVNYIYDIDSYLTLIILNIFFIFIGLMFLPEQNTKKYILPSMLIPLLMFLTRNIVFMIDIFELDQIVLVIAGAYLLSLGYSIIYKNEFSVPGIDTVNEILFEKFNKVSNIYVYIFELIIILITSYYIGVEKGIYSTIIIASIHYVKLRTIIGISSSKTFYIITRKGKEVKKFITEELKHDFTEFDTRGGFTKQKKKVIMTSIDTRDYYKLKENILNIDEDAFVTITDSFEVINKNKNIM